MAKSNILRRVQGVAWPVVVIAFGSGFTLAQATTPSSQSSAAVSVELACQHLFLAVADGPHAPSWNARSNIFKNTGLSQLDVARIIRRANTYAAGVADLSRQSVAIHNGVKTKLVAVPIAVQQLRALDNLRDSLFSQVYQQLRGDLNAEAWSQLQAFLENVVRPSVTLVE